MGAAVEITDITDSAQAAEMEGYYLVYHDGELVSRFGGKVLARLMLMEWPLNNRGQESKMILSALLFEHGRLLLAETFFSEREDGEGGGSEVYLGSSRCYRLNVPPDEYTEEMDESIMMSLYVVELGIDVNG